MEFYPGFSWAVPRAFAAAISACRFELGDVLYSNASAYGDSPAVDHYLQVLEPARSNRSLASESEGQRFFVNWEAAVRFCWTDCAKDSQRIRSSTQGRLFTCLWRGDPAVLDPERSEAPEPPRLLRDLHGCVEAAVPALRRSLRLGARSKSTHLFAFASDRASDASRSKLAAIAGVLDARFACRSQDLSPAQAEIDGGERFHPALVVRGVAITAASREDVHESLKRLLYRGSPRGPEAEASEDETDSQKKRADRFQLARHGVLVELD